MNISLIGGALNSKYGGIRASIAWDRAGKPHYGDSLLRTYVSRIAYRPYFNARKCIAFRQTGAVLAPIVAETHGQEDVEPLQSRWDSLEWVKQAKERGNGTQTLRGERANDAPFLSSIILWRTNPDAHYVMHMQAEKRIKKQSVKGQVSARDAPVSVLSSALWAPLCLCVWYKVISQYH